MYKLYERIIFIMEYYIFVTNKCNLNCKYCSVMLKNEEHNIPSEPIYSLEQLNLFIHNTQTKYNDSCADVVFFGGEPTLNYEYIQDIIESQQKKENKYYKFNYMLHTNGLELCNIPDNILSLIDSIMLSINYDMIPHAQLNEGYFGQIVNSINNVKKRKNIPIVGRLTITEDTSLLTEISLFNGLFDAIYWQIENCYEFEDFKRFYNSYKFELELVFNLWLNYLKNGILLNFIPFIASVNFLTLQETSSTFCCGYNKSMVYVQTNGDCYTCAEDMTTNLNLVGNIYDGILFDNFNLKDTSCFSCQYINLCQGRCGRMHREFNKNHIEEYCKLNKVLFDLILNNQTTIKHYVEKFNLNLDMTDDIYHYTEYTP